MIKEKIESSITKVEKWVEEHNYKGYEPFDGLSSFFRPLTFGNLFLERILMQSIRQSPLNLRPFLGVKPKESTKGRGYMAWGYLTMYRVTSKNSYKDRTIKLLEWLDKNKSPKYTNHSWANHYDFTGRGGRYFKHESIIVWTSLIGQVFLDAYEVIGFEKYLKIAESICSWILKLPREKTNLGSCLSYLAIKQSSIHNSNMLGAAMLARTAKHTGNSEYLNVAKDAMLYSCSRQNKDGSWYYGEDPMYHWIDNFHTGYNLDSLKCYVENTADKDFEKNLRLGFEFYYSHFFENNGIPKYYHDRLYPIDSQCASQSIETLLKFTDDNKKSLELAVRVANWIIDNMQDKSGYFYYRRYPFKVIAKTPMLHWAQATTYNALALLLSKL